ncbi:MAG: IS200/IS605 family transposase [Gammaproteobacteria bacterium]
MAHSLRAHYFHIVWATKNRNPLITPTIQKGLYPYMGGIIRNHQSVPLAIGGVSDHVHLLIELKKCDHYSTLIKNVKTFSSHWVHKNFPEHKAFAWQEGYASFSVSYSGLNQVKNYIQHQEKHHQSMSFEEEYLKILQHCQIKFDDRFVMG